MKKQVTNMEVKKNNRNRIFRYIGRSGTVSNPDIAYELKMSLPTVTQNTKELLERGLLEEVGELQSTGGRRAKALAVAADAKQAVGLDITKNHIGLLLTNLSGQVLAYERIQLPYQDSEEYYRKASELLENFLKEKKAYRERILGIGISFPGIVDLNREMIDHSHILGVDSLPFEAVSRFFPYPCSFLNDANAGAYAEGMGAGHQERFFYLSLSNTVGGGIFSNGELVQGDAFRCGEVGHMTIAPEGKLCYCGKMGCLDAYCSAMCLSDAAGGKLEKFFERLERKEGEAVKLWERYAADLAVAINNIHMVLDCDIVLGGYVGSCLTWHIQDIWKKVVERTPFMQDIPFVRGCGHKLGAAALGAALKVMEVFVEQI